MKDKHPFARQTILVALTTLFSQSFAFGADLDANLRAKLPEHIRTSGVIKVGSPRVIRPQVYLENGELTGLAVDIAKAIEPVLGVQFEWQDMQWPGIIPGLQAGSIDASIGIISYLPERADFLNMIPYVQDLAGVIVASDVSGVSDDPLSLCGRKLGGIQGTVYLQFSAATSQQCVDNGKPPIEEQVYSNSGTVLTAFRAHNIDGFVTTYVETLSIAKNGNNGDKVYAMTQWPTPATVVATAKQETALAEAIQGALQKIYDNGEYEKILAKYDLTPNALDRSEIAINPQ